MLRAGSRQATVALLALIASGCTVGPNYHRPAVSVPQTYRGASASPPSTAASFGDEKWWEVFQDPQLQALIRTALKQNYDLRIAATHILEAQAKLGIARGNQLPTAGAIAAGDDDCLALSADGQVFAWGGNSSGQLGDNSTSGSPVPVAVKADGALSGKTVVAAVAAVIADVPAGEDDFGDEEVPLREQPTRDDLDEGREGGGGEDGSEIL